MGFDQSKVIVDIRLSNHNSVNDDLDQVRLAWMIRDITAVVSRYFGEPDKDWPTMGPSIGGAGEHKWEVSTEGHHRNSFYLDELNNLGKHSG